MSIYSLFGLGVWGGVYLFGFGGGGGGGFCVGLWVVGVFFPIKYFPFIQVFRIFEGKMQVVGAKTPSGKLAVP